MAASVKHILDLVVSEQSLEASLCAMSELLAGSRSIEEQLSSRDRRDVTGDIIPLGPYNIWRRSALKAKNIIDAKYREFKQHVKYLRREQHEQQKKQVGASAKAIQRDDKKESGVEGNARQSSGGKGGSNPADPWTFDCGAKTYTDSQFCTRSGGCVKHARSSTAYHPPIHWAQEAADPGSGAG